MKRILALNGGGALGRFEPAICQRLEELRPGFTSAIDFIAGTSTGSLGAIGVASGMSFAEVGDLYDQKCGYIFERSWWRKYTDPLAWRMAKYPNDHLIETVKDAFGDTPLRDLLIPTLAVSVRLDKPSVGVDGAYLSSWSSRYGGLPAWMAAVASSSAPTYFPVFHLQHEPSNIDGQFVDGGMIDNDPSMAAVVEVLGKYPSEEVVVLDVSLGNSYNCPGVIGDAGAADWALHILQVLLNIGPRGTHRKMRIGLRDRYRQIEPILPRDYEMDDVSVMPVMTKLASEYDLTDIIAWLDKYWLV